MCAREKRDKVRSKPILYSPSEYSDTPNPKHSGAYWHKFSKSVGMQTEWQCLQSGANSSLNS